MVCRPSLEPDVLALLETNFAVNHMRSCVISAFAVIDTAVGAYIVPQLDFGLLRGHFHQSDFLVGSAAVLGSEWKYSGLTESAKQYIQRAGFVH